MKYWFGYQVRECECGFETPDEDEFARHLAKTHHKEKIEPVKKQARKKAVVEDTAEKGEK